MVTVRKYRRGDARAVANLISKTFARFNSREGDQEAVRRYFESYRPKGKTTVELHARFSRTPLCFVAISGADVLGVVRGVENRLINLFVDGKHHRRGIGTLLVKRFESACRASGSREILLRSSQYATPFYCAIGYRKTTGVRNFHGLKVQPMRKILQQEEFQAGGAHRR